MGGSSRSGTWPLCSSAPIQVEQFTGRGRLFEATIAQFVEDGDRRFDEFRAGVGVVQIHDLAHLIRRGECDVVAVAPAQERSDSSRFALDVRKIAGRMSALIVSLISRIVNEHSSRMSSRLSCTSDSVLSISSSRRTTRFSERNARPIGPRSRSHRICRRCVRCRPRRSAHRLGGGRCLARNTLLRP